MSPGIHWTVISYLPCTTSSNFFNSNFQIGANKWSPSRIIFLILAQMRMHSCLANLGMGGSHQRQAQQKLFVVLRITRVCLLLDRTKRASLGTEGTVLCGLAHMRKNVCAHSRNVYPLCATVWKWVLRQTSSVQFMSLGLLQRAAATTTI